MSLQNYCFFLTCARISQKINVEKMFKYLRISIIICTFAA